MYKQDNGGVESLLDQRKELLEELINSDIIDEEHGYYDDVKGAIESNDSEQMREIIDELLSSGLIYKDDWDYKLARKLSKESKKMVNGGGVGNYKEKNETMDKMGKFAEGSTEMLKVELANNIRTQRGMNKMMLENDMPKTYVGSAMKLQARAEDLVKELKHRDVNIDSILYKDYNKYRTGGSIEQEVPLRADIDGDMYEVIGVNHKLNKVRAKNFSSGKVIEMPIDNWYKESFEFGTKAKFKANGREYIGMVTMKDGQKSISLFNDEDYSGDAERIVPFNKIDLKTLKPTMEREKFAVGGEVGNQVSFKGDYGTPRSGIVKEKRGSSYIVATDNGDRLVDSYEVISFSDAPIEKKKRFGFFENGGGVGDWSGKNFNKYFSTEEAESMIETLKDSDEIKGFDVASMNDNGSKITVINAYTDRESSVNPWNLEMGKGEKWRFFIIPLKPMVELPKQVLAEIEGGGDKYKRGGFIYEVQKKGSPSNDMRETMFTAKNLTELKKQIIEKYGTSEGFLVSRRTDKGYYASVKYEGGGEIEGKIDKLNKVVNSKMLPEGVKDKARKQIAELEKQLHESEKSVFELERKYFDTKISKGKEYPVSIWEDQFGTEYITGQKYSQNERTIKTENTLLSGFNKLTESEKQLLKSKHESKETKAEEKEEHEVGGSEYKEKVGVSKIKILWAEGDNSKFDKFPKDYSSWALANKAIIPVYEDTIGNEGYNKVKFSVIFKDGETYDGRLDVSEREDNPIKSNNVIGQHIKDYLDYMASEKSVSSEDDKKEIKEWLEKYDLGLSGGSEAKKPTTRKAPVKAKEKILGIEYTVGTKGHAKALAEKKHLDDLNKSETSKTEPQPKFKVGERVVDEDYEGNYEILEIKYAFNPAEGKPIFYYNLNGKGDISSPEYSLKKYTKPKADHKKLLAKIKAKKGAAPSNEPSKGHKRSESSDRKREALPLGKRVSADGNTYYENRLNRADMNKEDKFKTGGEIMEKNKEWNLTVRFKNGSSYSYYGDTKKEALDKYKKAFGDFKGVTNKEWELVDKFEGGGEIGENNSGWGLKFLKW